MMSGWKVIKLNYDRHWKAQYLDYMNDSLHSKSCPGGRGVVEMGQRTVIQIRAFLWNNSCRRDQNLVVKHDRTVVQIRTFLWQSMELPCRSESVGETKQSCHTDQNLFGRWDKELSYRSESFWEMGQRAVPVVKMLQLQQGKELS